MVLVSYLAVWLNFEHNYPVKYQLEKLISVIHVFPTKYFHKYKNAITCYYTFSE